MPLKIGITGGIGSGKSTAAKLFELLKVPVYYADAAAKDLYRTNAPLRAALVERFGADIYQGETLDRAKLSSKIFANPEDLSWLNAQVHPLTVADAQWWMEAQNSPYVLKEAALLFEAGAAEGLDFVIGVYAPQHLRIKRVMDRDGLSREQVVERMNRQISEEIKMRLCDFVLVNDEQHLLVPQVLSLHEKLLSLVVNKSG